MKTIEELYNEVMANDDLWKEWVKAQNTGTQEAFLKKYDCSSTLEEAIAFIDEKNNEDEEISLDQLDHVAGGCSDPNNGQGGSTWDDRA